MKETRKLKLSISLLGEHGIPLRDEIELEMLRYSKVGIDMRFGRDNTNGDAC